jgi:hypothetical protein
MQHAPGQRVTGSAHTGRASRRRPERANSILSAIRRRKSTKIVASSGLRTHVFATDHADCTDGWSGAAASGISPAVRHNSHNCKQADACAWQVSARQADRCGTAVASHTSRAKRKTGTGNSPHAGKPAGPIRRGALRTQPLQPSRTSRAEGCRGAASVSQGRVRPSFARRATAGKPVGTATQQTNRDHARPAHPEAAPHTRTTGNTPASPTAQPAPASASRHVRSRCVARRSGWLALTHRTRNS